MVRLGVSLGLCVAVLAGCATLTEEQCQTVNWQALGVTDGERGFRKGRIGDHIKACEAHDLGVDQAAYLRGWVQGIPRYCTAQNGYDEGITGQRYRGSCPSDIAGPFEAAYEPARRLHDAEDEVVRLSGSIESARGDLRAAEALDDEDRDRDAIRKLRRSLRDLRRDLVRARQEEDNARSALFLFLNRNPNIRP